MLVIGTPLLVDSEDTSTKMSTTVYVIQWNASASTDNNGGFYQSANMAAGLMSVANDSSGTTKSPMTTTKKPQTTTASSGEKGKGVMNFFHSSTIIIDNNKTK
jgi:hypothetical protein